MEIDAHISREGFVYAKCEGEALYVVYISPNIGLEDYEEKLDEIMGMVRSRREQMLMGDFNAKASLWDSAVTTGEGPTSPPRHGGGKYGGGTHICQRRQQFDN